MKVEEPAAGRFVIDTSVAIEWDLPGIHQVAALRFLDPTFDRYAPDVLHAELGSVVLKKVRRRELTAGEARESLDRLVSLPLIVLETLPLRPAAFAVALEIGASFYDALFLTLAIHLGGRLVTADQKLYRKVVCSSLDSWILRVDADEGNLSTQLRSCHRT